MDLGSYLEHDGRPAVRFQRTYAHPIESVWAAITAPDELKHWFPSAVQFEQRVGGAVIFSGDPHTSDQTGTVLAFEPPRHLAFTWGSDELHLELEPVPHGCRLTLIDVLSKRNEAARNGAGWHVCLDELAKRLDGIPSDGPHSATTRHGSRPTMPTLPPGCRPARGSPTMSADELPSHRYARTGTATWNTRRLQPFGWSATSW